MKTEQDWDRVTKKREESKLDRVNKARKSQQYATFLHHTKTEKSTLYEGRDNMSQAPKSSEGLKVY